MKNKILKTITKVMFFVLLIGIVTIDSESSIPLIMIGTSLGWLLIFGAINGWCLDEIV